jgi:hypothetical protein
MKFKPFLSKVSSASIGKLAIPKIGWDNFDFLALSSQASRINFSLTLRAQANGIFPAETRHGYAKSQSEMR